MSALSRTITLAAVAAAATGAYLVYKNKVLKASKTKKPLYKSTRGWIRGDGITFEETVLMGLAPDGGLLVPTFFPQVSRDELLAWKNLSFQELAQKVMSKYIPEDQCSSEELQGLVNRSYATFRDNQVTPVVKASSRKGAPWILELFHGPTFAFKDVALQFLGNMFEHILAKKSGKESHITVVGATSGDTGSSAIMGLRGKKGVDVFIMFPHGRVSEIQERQMTTVLDKNIHNCAIEGTFDDAQAIVKALFNDKDFRAEYRLGAVNSINWCRIMAQIVYYFYAYFQVHSSLSAEEPLPEVSFSVPTGNFGDILAGYYAKRMGLPVKDLVVATNDNDILFQYFTKGEYKRAPKVTHTIAPSMDICVSSNFERFLFAMLGDDAEALGKIMSEFEATGKLGSVPGLLEKCQSEMKAQRLNQQQVRDTIKAVYEEHKYLLDPHSAIGVGAETLLKKAGALDDETPVVCLACAHWGKFPDAVGSAIGKSSLDQVKKPELLEKLKTMETRVRKLPASVEDIQSHIISTLKQ